MRIPVIQDTVRHRCSEEWCRQEDLEERPEKDSMIIQKNKGKRGEEIYGTDDIKTDAGRNIENSL